MIREGEWAEGRDKGNRQSEKRRENAEGIDKVKNGGKGRGNRQSERQREDAVGKAEGNCQNG